MIAGTGGRASLRIAVAQPVTLPLDVAANAAAHAAAVRLARARVVVFPELSLTGYELEAPPLDPGDPRLAPVVEACRASGSIALVGAPVLPEAVRPADATAAPRRQIGMIALDGTGGRVVYRKLHLGDQEPAHVVAGDRPMVLDVDGWRIGLAICRDTGVAAHAERTCALGVDVYAGGLVEAARDRHVLAERARRVAAAHGVWVVLASAAGLAGRSYPEAAGSSGIWRPDGSSAARAGPAPGQVVAAAVPPT